MAARFHIRAGAAKVAVAGLRVKFCWRAAHRSLAMQHPPRKSQILQRPAVKQLGLQ